MVGATISYKILNWKWNTVRQLKIINIVRNHYITYYLLLYWLQQNISFIIWFRVTCFYFCVLSSSLLRVGKLKKRIEWIKNQRRFMAKGKDVRVTVILECTSCVRNRVNKESMGISRYITQKNRHNTPSRLELRKFCPCCYKHTIHGEIKK